MLAEIVQHIASNYERQGDKNACMYSELNVGSAMGRWTGAADVGSFELSRPRLAGRSEERQSLDFHLLNNIGIMLQIYYCHSHSFRSAYLEIPPVFLQSFSRTSCGSVSM